MQPEQHRVCRAQPATQDQFTAAAILLLQEEKKLSIDDKLSKYVREYVEADKVTLRQLLNMVSGISDNDPAIYGDHLTQPITRKEMFANLNEPAADVASWDSHGLHQH